MFSLFLRLATRFFLKEKKFFFSNILGLSLAFISILFIYSWISSEKSYDKYCENSPQIFRFTVEMRGGSNTRHFARVNKAWLKEFKGFFPEIEELVRLAPGRNSALKINENKFYSKGVFTTDSNFFKVFNVPLIQGNPSIVLNEPNVVVINESTAKKYFPGENPVGKQILWSHQQDTSFYAYTIKGVMPDFPKNSHFHPEMLLSFKNKDEWGQWFYTYILLNKGSTVAAIENKFDEFKAAHIQDAESREHEIFHLQNLEEIHLQSHKDRELEPNGDPHSITLLHIVALVLLLVVSLNYMNSQIASTLQRMGYFNVSKACGAQNKTFFSLLTVESVVLVVVSALLSLVVYYLAAPSVSGWLGIELYLSWQEKALIFLLVLLFFLFLGISTGIYPVVLLSGHGIFGRFKNTINEFSIRKVLVIAQFVGGICLVIITSIIIKQNQYLMANRIGGGQDNIINLVDLPRSAVDKYGAFKQELLKDPSILDVTASMEEPAGEAMDAFKFELEGMAEEEKDKIIFLFPTDHNFNQFYGNKIIAGEDYYGEIINSKKYIINKAALHFLGYDNPNDIIGKRFKLIFPYEDFFNEGYIGGVIEDFHITSMQAYEKPMVLYHQPFFNYCVGIKFDPQQTARALVAIREVWDKINPDYDLQSYFIDDLFFRLYANQIRQSKFLFLLAFVALFISSLGLFNMAVYNINKRTKEIGVRKVNGANTLELLGMLNSTFLKWVAIAFVLAVPVSWLAMKQWLENFAYKTTMSWWLFALAGLAVLAIALLTVSFQVFKAASKNPVQALRYE